MFRRKAILVANIRAKEAKGACLMEESGFGLAALS